MIKWGKPVLNVEYKTIKSIAYGTAILNMFNVLFCISILISALKIKVNLGDYINMISENDGNVLPTLLILPAILYLPLNSASILLLYKVFDNTCQYKLNNLLFIFVMVSLGSMFIMFMICITVLAHSYSSHVALHDGIVDAMGNYGENSLVKAKIDVLQLQFQCCGSKHYSEWFEITWYDIKLTKNKIVKQQVPFSCCSMKSMFPCIHHNVDSKSLPYKYSQELNFSLSLSGCATAIKREKKIVAWGIIGRIVLMILTQVLATAGIRFIQTAQCAAGVLLDNEEKLYTMWLFGYYIENQDKPDPRVQPMPHESRANT